MRLSILALVGITLVVLVAAWVLLRRVAERSTSRALVSFRSRIDRFKLTGKAYIRESLLADDDVATAVRAHAAEHGMAESDVWRRVERYIDEIVPFFNILAYYRFGYPISRALLNLFYKVSVDFERQEAMATVPRDATVIYLMNHRSNADYVLVGYVLSGKVAISYAVGEWARAFPLEFIFKSFGSYFIRRRFREPLYHAVLERYVQLITRNGVTQGIFPEGGLSRDGRLQPGKIGLLDYMLGVARDPSYRERMYVVPVAVNYDRVLEDRSLLRELDAREGRGSVSRLTQLAEVTSYVWWNLGRLVVRRWKRYGRAAVTVGEPIALAPWFRDHPDLFELPRAERLSRVQQLCDRAMSRIGAIIPVTPVPLACAALQSFDGELIRHDDLIARMQAMRDLLLELNARVLRADRDVEETLEIALKMFRMRRLLEQRGDAYHLPNASRQLIGYYANSIAHLLGPYEGRLRDQAGPVAIPAGS